MAQVLKVNLDADKKKATGVTYLDAQGREPSSRPTWCCCARSRCSTCT
jgi:hypothetical protein